MASIVKRGESYRARVRHRGRGAESATFPTLALARAWAASREGEIANGRAGLLPRRTVKDAIDRYLEREAPQHKGERWERLRLAKIGRNLDWIDRPLAAVTREMISDWRDGLTRKLAASSARREYGLLRRIFALAATEWGWLHADPFRAVRPPPAGKPRSQRVADAEADAIYVALGWTPGTPPKNASQALAAAFALALETAMRQSELLRLTRADVDTERRVLEVRQSKNNDARTVPLSRAALAILAVLPDKGRLFPINARSADTLFRRARDAGGLKHIHFHDSRREAVTRLADMLDPLTLALMTGHRDLKVLLRTYYQPRMDEVAARLD